jgi:primosomal protein N' (replication factor Y)
MRRAAGMPPFARLAAIIVSAATKEEARAHAVALARAAPRPAGVDVLGPAEAPLAILRGRYRFRLLVRAPRGFDIQTMIAEWFRASPPPRGSLRRTIDIDPQSFL